MGSWSGWDWALWIFCLRCWDVLLLHSLIMGKLKSTSIGPSLQQPTCHDPDQAKQRSTLSAAAILPSHRNRLSVRLQRPWLQPPCSQRRKVLACCSQRPSFPPSITCERFCLFFNVRPFPVVFPMGTCADQDSDIEAGGVSHWPLTPALFIQKRTRFVGAGRQLTTYLH
jgi:hypothetical protein